MFVIRNTDIKKLVTDSRRVPLLFRTIEKAELWLRRNGNPNHLKAVSAEIGLNSFERNQLSKVDLDKAM